MTWKPNDAGEFVMAKPRLVVRPRVKAVVQALVKDKLVATESEAVELLLHLCSPFLELMLARQINFSGMSLDIDLGAPTKGVLAKASDS